MISVSLLNSILNYLATKPYKEVNEYIQAAQQEIAQHQAAQEKGTNLTVTTTDNEKGEE